MPTPEPISIATAITALTSIGILPVITVVAVLGIAVMLYKRFRK
jgi:hypothetical protein